MSVVRNKWEIKHTLGMRSSPSLKLCRFHLLAIEKEQPKLLGKSRFRRENLKAIFHRKLDLLLLQKLTSLANQNLFLGGIDTVDVFKFRQLHHFV
ncbi:unnamed protein product [Linum trigynum]|uniref:Uncharacterized protein n=1 Tax=Linum trigynum TaxID=586398 RepID=A0AAV2FA96_9ROSI